MDFFVVIRKDYNKGYNIIKTRDVEQKIMQKFSEKLFKKS